MSGFAGIYNLDGRPADSALLVSMLEAIAHRGPDGLGHRSDGPVSLGSAVLCTTPESLHEREPFYDHSSGLSIVMDGRVDNRDALNAELGASSHTATDPEIVLRAYQRWAEDSPRRILGDFAYAIWDPRARRLFCARDHFGIRPFHYFTDGHVFLWASEPHQLFHHSAVPKRPNEGMIAEYLSDNLTSFEETLYEDVLRLPPAHFLSVSPGGLRKQRYWDIDPRREIRYKTDREYADHFHSVFKETVRCRLRSHRPIAAELSGGVDSSSVVGMCRHLFHDGAAPGLGFETLSLVYPGLGCDETPYQRQVVEFCNLKSNQLPFTTDPLWYPACASRYLDIPDHPNFHMSDGLAVLAQQQGIRVVLTGQGGDHWFTFWPPESRFRRAYNRLRSQPNLATVGALSRGCLAMLCRRALASRHPTPRHPTPRWIPDDFALRTRLRDRLRKPPLEFSFRSRAQKAMYAALADAFQVHFQELQDRACARYQVEHRHPFHDRRIIEFALALPEDQISRNGQTKFILRQAMKGLVPEPVLQRTTKAEFSAASALVFESETIAPLFHSSLIAAQGWIDQQQVSTMYCDSMAKWRRSRNEPLPRVWPLSMVLGIELWFRAAFPNGCHT